jgi:hypothetical protein
MRFSRLAAVLVFLSCPVSAGENGKSSAAGTTLLNAGSHWRWHKTMRPPAVSAKSTGKKVYLKGRGCDHLTSTPPSADWRKPDFDDAHWPRSSVSGMSQMVFCHYSTALVCLRGKFRAVSPGAVKKLLLEMKFRGGVVVYLNGTEVARAHMPEGTAAADTPALPYPKEAYAGPDGKPIPDPGWYRYHMKRRKKPQATPKWMSDGIAMRTRSLGPVEVPVKHLRKGVNVLALELHRTDYPAIALKWFKGLKPEWIPIGLSSIKLRAAGTGFESNARRPKAFHIWPQDVNEKLLPRGYGSPGESSRPLRIVAARNGTFCAQLGVSSGSEIRGIRAEVSDLKAVKGDARIPASATDVLYGHVGKVMPGWYDNFVEDPPPLVPALTPSRGHRGVVKLDGATLPVLLRLNVPKDASPGDYRGTVTVSADGVKSQSLPVEVHVVGWRVPDPRNYRTYMGVYQSPTSVALQYKVKPWSEAHWRLLAEAFKLLGRLGNKLVLVDAVEETQFGNERGMVYWVKKPDGSYDYDFSVFDRYLKLALKHCDKPDYVAVQVWHVGSIHKTGHGWGTSPMNQKVTVTLKDPKSGELSSLRVPVFATEESKKFWKPFLAALSSRLEKAGVKKNALCLGILWDTSPKADLFRMFDEIWPGGGKSRWMRGCHVPTNASAPYPVKKRGPGLVTLHEHCYGMSMVGPGVKQLPPIHAFRGRPGTAYYRYGGHDSTVSLIGYHTMAPRALWTQKQGVGRICLDWWPVLKGRGGRATDLYNRYPYSSCMQRAPVLMRLSWPGPKGHRPTLRFEMASESVQLAEAMIVISEALANNEGKLGADLAAKCRSALRDQLRFCHIRFRWRPQNYIPHPDHLGWQELSRRIYTCAAEVAEKPGK